MSTTQTSGRCDADLAHQGGGVTGLGHHVDSAGGEQCHDAFTGQQRVVGNNGSHMPSSLLRHLGSHPSSARVTPGHRPRR